MRRKWRQKGGGDEQKNEMREKTKNEGSGLMKNMLSIYNIVVNYR